MKKDIKILVVNDDGISSDWLAALAAAASKFGRVWVAAPASQCSGMSLRITLFEPIEIKKLDDYPVDVEAAYSIGGSPADCTKIAIKHLMKEKPDYVFSGINKDYNAGYDTAYSGTVGAAMEGVLNGVPSIAFSADARGSFEVTEHYLESVIAELLEQPASLDFIWNVNIPGCKLSECKGILRDRAIAPQSPYILHYSERSYADGTVTVKPYAELTDKSSAVEGTDVHAVLNGYISIGKIRCFVK